MSVHCQEGTSSLLIAVQSQTLNLPATKKATLTATQTGHRAKTVFRFWLKKQAQTRQNQALSTKCRR